MKKRNEKTDRNKTGLKNSATLEKSAADPSKKQNWADEKLLQSQKELLALMDASPIGISWADRQGNIQYLNRKHQELFGYTLEDIPTIDAWRSLAYPDPAYRQQVPPLMNQITEAQKHGKEAIPIEITVTCKDGSFRHVMQTGAFTSNHVLAVYHDITEYKETEEKLRLEKELHQSAEKYRAIIEGIQEGYFEVDLAGNFTFFNNSVCRILGYPREELRGMNYQHYTDKEEFEKVYHAYNKVYITGEPNNALGWQVIRKDGTKRYVEGSVSLLKDSSGKSIGFRGIIHDITGRKETEEKLRQSEEKYRTILETMQEAYFEVNLAGSFTFFNDSFCRILGYSREEMTGMNYRKYMDEENAKRTYQRYNKVYTTGEPAEEFGWEMIKKDGTRIYVEESISLIKDSSGKTIGFRGIVRDVTERRQTEETLRQSEEKYRTIIEKIEDGYYEVDLTGKLTFFNNATCVLYGYSKEELMGMTYQRYTDKENARKLFQAFNEVYRTGIGSHVFEYEAIRKDGTKRQVEIFTSLMKDSESNLRGFRGIIRDITERRKAEETLRQSEEKYRTILENIEEGYYEVDLSGKFTFFNDSMCQITGYSREELTGMSYQQYADEENSKKVFQEFNKLYTTRGSTAGFDWQMIRKDGARRYIEASASLIKDSSGKSIGFRGIVRDITERKKAEEKIRQTLNSLKKAVGTTIQVLVTALETRDPYTAGHQSQSANLAYAIATEMGLPQDKIEGINMAGIIHDIGKLSIPAEILSKPTKLTNLEIALIQEHAHSGFEMLKDVESPWPLAEIVYQHHERINGSGYPRNLKGDEILMEARILGVADVVEAMASHRPYRPALGIEVALEEIEKNKGILYDTAVADTCLKLFREKGYQIK
ncbi:MAG: PAS domain S-box protein [Syntrophaceae bacterium]|nr:PAS domain S-box protein [Syntrophaceae bacterium]